MNIKVAQITSRNYKIIEDYLTKPRMISCILHVECTATTTYTPVLSDCPRTCLIGTEDQDPTPYRTFDMSCHVCSSHTLAENFESITIVHVEGAQPSVVLHDLRCVQVG